MQSAIGTRMMAKMGWEPGEPLGARGVGLMTPLRSVEWLGRRGLASEEDRGPCSSPVFVSAGFLPPVDVPAPDDSMSEDEEPGASWLGP